jgi:hypothetical protein
MPVSAGIIVRMCTPAVGAYGNIITKLPALAFHNSVCGLMAIMVDTVLDAVFIIKTQEYILHGVHAFPSI